MLIIDKTDGRGCFPDGTRILDFFGKVNGLPGGERVQMGISVLPAGGSTEFSSHPGDEYSFLISGKMICFTADETYAVPTGAAIFTPAGQLHRSENPYDEDCICLWIEVDVG